MSKITAHVFPRGTVLTQTLQAAKTSAFLEQLMIDNQVHFINSTWLLFTVLIAM